MPSGRERLRVLLIAEACNPAWSSVPLVGYNLAQALACRPDLQITVATHVRNRPMLADSELAQRASIHYVDNEWLTGPLFRLSKWLRGGTTLSWTTVTALAWPSYQVFESALFARFRRQLEAGYFDLIHRVTPLTPTIPSPLAGWVRTPMLLGPLNGGLPWPTEYPELRRQEREWLTPLRGLYRKMPGYGTCWRHLAGVVAGSRHTATEIPADFRGRRFYIPENGIDPTRFPLQGASQPTGKRFRFLTAGRLVPYKGVDLTLEALAGSSLLRQQSELVVIGDGPMRQSLENQAAAAGLTDCVRFLGWLPQAELANQLRTAQAFAFPSLREFGGGVVLEAMASGLAPVVVGHGGPGELVGDCGVVLPLQPRQQLVADLRQAMESLVSDPGRTRALGQAACERVRNEFTWERKADRIVAAYREVLQGDSAR